MEHSDRYDAACKHFVNQLCSAAELSALHRDPCFGGNSLRSFLPDLRKAREGVRGDCKDDIAHGDIRKPPSAPRLRKSAVPLPRSN